MAYANFETREIHCKVLYLGARGSGKTENLRSIYQKTSLKLAREPVTFDEAGAVPYEFLPLAIGQLRDFQVKMHIYTMPDHSLYPTFGMVLTRGIDGIVFVLDSRVSALQDNIDALLRFKDILTQEGYNFSAMPRVLQYNKRDHEQAIPLDLLRQEFNPNGLAELEAIATQHLGTLETVQKIASLVLDELGKT